LLGGLAGAAFGPTRLAIYAVLVIWSEARILYIALLLEWFEVGRDRALETIHRSEI
jgi:hypothetical protein